MASDWQRQNQIFNKGYMESRETCYKYSLTDLNNILFLSDWDCGKTETKNSSSGASLELLWLYEATIFLTTRYGPEEE